MFIVVAVTAAFLDVKYAVVICIFVPALLLIKNESKIVLFLGSISYSLYLLHPIIGQKVVNLSMNFVRDPVGKFFVALLALGISIVASYILYLVLERPSMLISKRIRYRSDKTTASDAVPDSPRLQESST
jgi:peptidoglycan/LPS O-acetylase OafA/YrhL